MDKLFLNEHLPVFGKQNGMMRERMGYCTTSYGHDGLAKSISLIARPSG